MKRSMLFIALLATATLATAAPWSYRGTLNDGGKPANGNYDVRLTLINAAGTASVSQPITVFNVPVKDGSFSAEVDFGMDLTNAPAMKLKAEVNQGSSGFVSLGEPSAFDPKSVLAVGACWSSTGDNGSNPTVNFLGNTDNQTMVVSSPSGISMNKRAQIAGSSTDILIAPKSSGDSDADIGFETRTGKTAAIYVRESNGNLVVNSGGINEFFASNSIAAAGSPTSVFQGRMQSDAGGTTPTSPGGGMWLGSDTGATSYMGRGNNADNFTGIWHDGIWRMVVTESGQTMLNRTTAVTAGDDLVLAPQPTGDPDMDIALTTRATSILNLSKQANVFLSHTTGGLNMFMRQLQPGAARLAVGAAGTGGDATLSNGGTWTNASSRTYKEGFSAINPLDVLHKLVAMPITTWTYKGSSEGTHMGPVAEDFKETFGLAGDGKSIGTVDADGVALAAIQGLNQKLESENAALKARLDAIEAKLAD